MSSQEAAGAWSHTFIVISIQPPLHASKEWIADGISSADNMKEWQCPKVCMAHCSGKTCEWIAVLRWTTNHQIYNAMYVTIISTLCFIHHLSKI